MVGQYPRRAYTYKVIDGPAVLPVTVDEFKNYIKQPNLPVSQDGLITLLLESAVDCAELITKRYFITRQVLTFRDYFPQAYQTEGYYDFGVIPGGSGVSSYEKNVAFELRKSPLQQIDSIEYFKDGSLITIDPSEYYSTFEEDYSEVLSTSKWPSDNDDRMQSIQITFTAGYGDAGSDVPAALRNAILAHATYAWTHRGDCCDESNLPTQSKSIYMKYRIENL